MVESLLDEAVLRPWVIDLRRGERSFDTLLRDTIAARFFNLQLVAYEVYLSRCPKMSSIYSILKKEKRKGSKIRSLAR